MRLKLSLSNLEITSTPFSFLFGALTNSLGIDMGARKCPCFWFRVEKITNTPPAKLYLMLGMAISWKLYSLLLLCTDHCSATHKMINFLAIVGKNRCQTRVHTVFLWFWLCSYHILKFRIWPFISERIL